MLGYVINTVVLSMDQIGVVPWSLLLWLIWLVLHIIYKKCFQALLSKINVKEPERRHLVRIYWKIAFTVITIPFALRNLNITVDDLKLRFYPSLISGTRSEWFKGPPAASVQAKLSYVILTGYYLDNICETVFIDGIKSKAFLLEEFLTIFFITTFPLKCVLFGIAFTTFVNVEKCVLELCRLCCCVKNILNSHILRFVSWYLLGVHTMIWYYLYLSIFPFYFLFAPINRTGRHDFAIFCFSLATLWLYYIMEFITSPFSRAVFNFFYGKPNSIESIIFKTEKVHLEIPEEPPKPKETRRHLLQLCQTVKCVIRIKRKLKKIREKKKLEATKECM